MDWGPVEAFHAVDVVGTQNLLKVAKQRGIKRFVQFSSIAALGLGRDQGGLTEEAERIVTGIPYCDSKIEVEDTVIGYCEENDLPFTIIRPANVIGAGSVYDRKFLDYYQQLRLPTIGGGNIPAGFVAVKNLVSGVLLAAESSNGINEVFHFMDGYSITWREYPTFLGEQIGRAIGWDIPYRVGWGAAIFFENVSALFNVRPLLTRHLISIWGDDLNVDASKAQRELGWESKYTIEETLEEIGEWIHTVYLADR